METLLIKLLNKVLNKQYDPKKSPKKRIYSKKNSKNYLAQKSEIN